MTTTSLKSSDNKREDLACYDLQCNICDYEWRTKYPRIPAQCPACRSSMHGTDNFSILREVFYTDKSVPGTKEYGQDIGHLIGGIFMIFFSLFLLGYGLIFTLLAAGIGVIVTYQKSKKLGFI